MTVVKGAQDDNFIKAPQDDGFIKVVSMTVSGSLGSFLWGQDPSLSLRMTVVRGAQDDSSKRSSG